jgi:hypothetical protein
MLDQTSTPPSDRPDDQERAHGQPLPIAAPSARSAAGGAVRLHLDAASRLWLHRGELSVRVKPVRCFPWSTPGELISLRDEGDREALLVQRPADLDPASAAALGTALRGAGFVLEIERVDSIEEDYEMRIWHTMTRQGKRTFQTQLDEWPWPSPDGGHLVRDLAGDLFRVPPLETLDEKSRSCLWAYVG